MNTIWLPWRGSLLGLKMKSIITFIRFLCIVMFLICLPIDDKNCICFFWEGRGKEEQITWDIRKFRKNKKL